MHIKGKSNWIKHLDFIALNLLSLPIGFAIAYFIRFNKFDFFTSFSWRRAMALMCLINLLVSFVMNPYSDILRRPYYEDAIKGVLFTLYSFVLISVFFYITKIGSEYSRITIILAYAIHFLIAFIFISIRKQLLLSGKVKGFANRNRTLFIVSEYEGIEETLENIDATDIATYDVAGFCFTDGIFRDASYRDRDVVPLEKVTDYVITEHIDDVFVSVDPATMSAISYRKIIENGVSVHLNLDSIIGTEGDDQFISRIGVYKAASIGPYTFDGKRMVYLMVKRVCDVFIGMIGCIVLVPLTAMVKISNVLSGDFAPVFYSQTRVGQYGKPFKLYKYRTMVPNADEVLKELLQLEDYRKQWEANQKFDNDPRITRIGKLLRRTSLDEFPQFINLVKGEMSLIGPRPLIVGELSLHDGLTLYNRVKPGITGWWACNGRSNINYRERLELEYYYVKNCSLYLDVLCIIRTILAVIRREGAQ